MLLDGIWLGNICEYIWDIIYIFFMNVGCSLCFVFKWGKNYLKWVFRYRDFIFEILIISNMFVDVYNGL